MLVLAPAKMTERFATGDFMRLASQVIDLQADQFLQLRSDQKASSGWGGASGYAVGWSALDARSRWVYLVANGVFPFETECVNLLGNRG